MAQETFQKPVSPKRIHNESCLLNSRIAALGTLGSFHWLDPTILNMAPLGQPLQYLLVGRVPGFVARERRRQ